MLEVILYNNSHIILSEANAATRKMWQIYIQEVNYFYFHCWRNSLVLDIYDILNDTIDENNRMEIR